MDLRPTVLTAMTFADGPKLTDRGNVTLTGDLKAGPRLVLSFTGMFNSFENSGHTRNLVWTAAANGVTAATGRQNVLGDGLTEISYEQGSPPIPRAPSRTPEAVRSS
jgi:hypothetical protein